MKLSIIIPTYNSAKVIRKAIDSIINQTFDDWELLIMDGVSKDETVAIAKSYHNAKIRVFSENDKGIYDAMNKGIAKSNGEWLYFLGSDDWLYDNDVLRSVFIDSDISNYDVIYGEADAEQLDERHKGEWNVGNIEFNRCHQAIFYKKTVFGRLGSYNLKYKMMADWDFNLKWFFDKKLESQYLPICVAHYTDGGASSHTLDKEFYSDVYWNIFVLGKDILNVYERFKYLKLAANENKIHGYKLKYYLLRTYKFIFGHVNKLKIDEI